MIKSFKNSDTENVYNCERVSRFSNDLQRAAERKLELIASAHNVNDLRVPPGNQLEALKGDRKGQFSIRINRQYRICFRWEGDDAYDVEITDYHK